MAGNVNCIFVFLQMYLNIWTIRAIFHFKGVSQLGRQPDGCGLSICSTVLPLWQILPNGIADDFFKKQDFLHSSSVIKRETGVLAVGWGWCQDFLQHQMFWWFYATTRLGDDTFQSFDPMKHWLDGCALKVDLGVTYFQVAHDTSQFYTSARQENMWSFFFLIFQHSVFHGHGCLFGCKFVAVSGQKCLIMGATHAAVESAEPKCPLQNY